MMIDFRRERILFVFSDPGGAKPILALADILGNDNKIFVCSNREYDFYNEFDAEVNIVNVDGVNNIFENFNPTIVITGTSYTTNFELIALKCAIDKRIDSYSFVDNWSNFVVRFMLDGHLVIPKKIWVIDEKAFLNAAYEKIHKSSIEVLGYNPYWKYLQNWKPKFTKEEIYDHYNLDKGKDFIYFVPDPLSNVGGLVKFGFDEYSSTPEIYEFYKDLNFIFKLHPNQDLRIKECFADLKITFVLDNIFHNHLMFYSKVVVSFFSNALMEAKILGVNPQRYLKGLKVNDPFEDKSIEVIFHNHQ